MSIRKEQSYSFVIIERELRMDISAYRLKMIGDIYSIIGVCAIRYSFHIPFLTVEKTKRTLQSSCFKNNFYYKQRKL